MITPNAKLYRDAAAALAERGHTKHKLGANNGEGPVCLLGALNVAQFGHPLRWQGISLNTSWGEVGKDLAKHLPADVSPNVATAPDPLGRVVVWNDEPERKAEEVIALLNRAAEAHQETP